MICRIALALAVLLVAIGCGSAGSDVLGRWEGVSQNGFRVVLNLKRDGGALVSKLGSRSGGFREHPVSWTITGDQIEVRSHDQVQMRFAFGGDVLEDPSGSLRLRRSSPLSGFRYPLLTALIALAVSWLLTPWVRKLAIQKGAVDDPKSDDRRVHTEPTPRWGGLAIYGGMVVALASVLFFAFPGQWPVPRYLLAMLCVGAVVVVMGALDDLYQFRPLGQAAFLLACGVAVQFFYDRAGHIQIPGLTTPFTQEWSPFGWMAIPITAIYVFVVTKTMDTIDGIDGLAAGIAAIAGATLAIIGAYSGQPRVAIVAAAISGSAIGFLRHNYNPAKIFMGTGGAQLLGFSLACLSIVGALKTAAAVSLIVPVLVFGVPIFDAVFVVIRRLLGRQPLTQGDKRHLHHTLLSKGLTQRQAVWVLYLAAITLCGLLLAVVRLYG